MAISLDDAFIAVPLKDHCDILEASTGKVMRSIPGPTYSARSVIWSPDGNRLWSLEPDGRILDWRAS